jgi:hypothetical protein
LHLILRRVRQRAFVLEDLAEIAALKPAAAGRTADEVFGIILRRKLNYSVSLDRVLLGRGDLLRRDLHALQARRGLRPVLG